MIFSNSHFYVCSVFGLDEECRNTGPVISSSDRDDDDDRIEVNPLTDVLQRGTTNLCFLPRQILASQFDRQRNTYYPSQFRGIFFPPLVHSNTRVQLWCSYH